jgi:NAD(P)-dependent dehydrogenase (short-subunit alcohol dehydrogenase family)
MEIRGKVVIITGASAGLGEATARLLSGKGACVALAARSADKLSGLAAELPGSLAVPTDLRDAASVVRMVAEVHAHYGRIDLVINNAGQGMIGPLEHVTVEQYRQLMDLNLYVPLLAMQAVIPIMRAQGGGLILNISTPLTRLPMYIRDLGAYTSTKAALNVITLTARAELAAGNIRVGVVYPGLLATDFGAHALVTGPAQPERAADAAGSHLAGAPPRERPEAVAAMILEAVQREPAEYFATAFLDASQADARA